MDDIIKYEKELVSKIEGLKDDIEAIQQPRSDFALIHFVVGMHDTPGRQRAQAVLELQIKMFNIKRTQLEERKLRVQIRQQEQLQKSSDTDIAELAGIEIEKLETDLAEMNLARLGNIREAKALLAILDALPKYTYEQIQAEEIEYWQARLARQAMQDLKTTGTIGVGNAEAITQLNRNIGEAVDPSLAADELKALVATKEVAPE